MAGDWIKVRTNLGTDPRVYEIAAKLGTSPLHVVGMLVAVWSWADQHTLDGNAVRVTGVTLDALVSCPGFAAALRDIGWLAGRDGALTFPRFDEHNGQTAKKRAETASRVKRHRNARSVTEALPEKRREEKSNTLSLSRASPLDKAVAEAVATAERLGLPADAVRRWVEYRAGVDGRPPSSDSLELQLVELARRGAQAAEIIAACIREEKPRLFADACDERPGRGGGGKPRQGKDYSTSIKEGGL